MLPHPAFALTPRNRIFITLPNVDETRKTIRSIVYVLQRTSSSTGMAGGGGIKAPTSWKQCRVQLHPEKWARPMKWPHKLLIVLFSERKYLYDHTALHFSTVNSWPTFSPYLYNRVWSELTRRNSLSHSRLACSRSWIKLVRPLSTVE